MKWTKYLLVGVLLMGSAIAAPRIAVHPLDVGPMSPDQRAKLQAWFEVMLARLAGVRLAVSRLEDALDKDAGKSCAERDSCLRFIAEATNSLYGCYVSVGVDTLGNEVTAAGRVVRSDGEVARKATTVTASLKGRSVAEAGREALTRLLNELALAQLPDSIPVATAPVPSSPTPAVMAQSPVVATAPVTRASVSAQLSALRPVIGWSLVGMGGVGLVGGGVLAGIAAAGKAGLGADAAGVVPVGKAEVAASVVQQSRLASVLLAAGGTAAAAGLLVALWPASSDSQLQLAPSVTSSGASLVLIGRMP